MADKLFYKVPSLDHLYPNPTTVFADPEGTHYIATVWDDTTYNGRFEVWYNLPVDYTARALRFETLEEVDQFLTVVALAKA